MTIQEAYHQTLYKLFELYDDRESANICDWLIEHITGFKKIDRIAHKNFLLNLQQEKLLKCYLPELLQHKPVQYVLHEAWFAGIKLYVDENVLIPRPETEELIDWIIGDCRLQVAETNPRASISNLQFAILDIGTGSGCIPVALKKKLSNCEIHAVDISENILAVAKRNAADQQTEIYFHKLDILDEAGWKQLPAFDIIVSNPPYIKQSEATEMHKNVLQHEPNIALFVADKDALLFYKTIAAFGLQHLKPNGKLFFEINEAHGKEICDLIKQYGYNKIELRKDMQGKERMVKAAYNL